MKLSKRILRSDRLRRALCFLISLYVRLIHVTTRWERHEEEFLKPLYDSGKPFMMALWHNRVVMMPHAWRFKDEVTIFTSDHRDGRLVAYVMQWFGFTTIHGSTNRTDLGSLRQILRHLKDGGYFGMTPDGPRGPRMRLKAGVISIARLSGCPIIPIAYSTSNRRLLNTWDRLCVPLPFGRGVYLWGEPIYVPKDADADEQEALRQEFEDRLFELTARADEMMGHARLEKADPDDYRRKRGE